MHFFRIQILFFPPENRHKQNMNWLQGIKIASNKDSSYKLQEGKESALNVLLGFSCNVVSEKIVEAGHATVLQELVDSVAPILQDGIMACLNSHLRYIIAGVIIKATPR